MPTPTTTRDGCTALELDEAQLALLDRALGGFAKALEAARDLGVISHETFCGKADKARAVQYLVWEAKERLEATRRESSKASNAETPSGEG